MKDFLNIIVLISMLLVYVVGFYEGINGNYERGTYFFVLYIAIYLQLALDLKITKGQET